MEEGKIYKFYQLEASLKSTFDQNNAKFYRVRELASNAIGLMTVFQENFSEYYVSGDAVIFYHDGEVHSAETHREFEYMGTVFIRPQIYFEQP